MSVSVEGSTQDVEINLAPIIDCFTVLITYLLVTASFLTLASVDVSVSATGTGAPPPPGAPNLPPPWSMTVELKSNLELEVQIKGGPKSEKFSYVVPATVDQKQNPKWNLPQLTERLRAIQAKYPTLSEANVTAHPTVIYKDVVNVLHEIQTTMPKVFISG